MKKIFTLCTLIPNLFLGFLFLEQGGVCSLQAQSNDFVMFPKMQSLIGPSPQAAAFTKYGDYPVNFNTGLVDMRIPLYNVKSGSLSMPIDISFHASGRMANETNGVLGMRWVLNAGGVVTRTVHGYPDEWNDLTPYVVNTTQAPDYDELRRSSTQGFIAWENINSNYSKTDSELDEFTYVLPTGKSGKFVLKIENGIKKAVQIPYEALKIEFVKDNSYYGYYGSIKITDVDGTIYNYGNVTIYNSNYHESNQDNPAEYSASPPTGWYLKNIISADRKDMIEFDYQNVWLDVGGVTEKISIGDRVRDESINANFHQDDTFGPELFNTLQLFPVDDPEWSYSNSTMTVPVLQSIKFKDGELNFSYTGYSNTSSPTLQHIVLSGAINKKFKFNQVLSPNEKFIRYLKSLEVLSFSASIEKTEEKYSFDYYEPNGVNQTFTLGYSSEKKDWWGYYNFNTTDLVPFMSVPLVIMDQGNTSGVYRDIGHYLQRDPDLESMQFGMLKSITYPTSGKTEFEYENNYYKEYNYSSQNYFNKIGPGLRIKKVTNKPIIGAEIAKTYKYGINEDGAGYINPALKPNENRIQEVSMMVYWDYGVQIDFRSPFKIYFNEQAGYRIRDYSSDPFINPADLGGNIVRYDMVTEYFEGNQISYNSEWNNSTTGKIIYEYSTKEFDTKNFEIRDTEYQYTDYPKIFADQYRQWKGGKLLAKTIFKKEDYLLIPTLKETYNYIDSTFEELWDMPIYRHVLMQNIRSKPDNDRTQHMYDLEKDYHNNICPVYGYGYRKYVSGSEKLSSKTIEHFDGTGISTTSDYFYDTQYDQLKKEETISSDRKQIRFEYEYPFDNNSLAINNKMVQMNMISTPLSKSQFVGGAFMQSKRTAYFEPYPNVIRPEMEYYKKGSNTEEPIIIYNNYDDKGNPTELQMADGTKIVYLWGYNKTQLIAKIENATYASISPSLITSAQTASDSGVEADLITSLSALRTALPYGMVSTYTYKPLIGVSTITDPKGDTITYTYDSYGRLQNVKDKDGNILSENEYHYKN